MVDTSESFNKIKDSDLSKTGILLLSHGSRLPHGSNVINSLSEMYQDEFPGSIVETGFMEITEPNIPQAFENLKKHGELDRIIVVPVFVAHGLHTKRDIPKILGLENEEDSHEEHHHGEGHPHKDHHGEGHHGGHHHGGGHHHHHHEIEKVDFDGEIIFTDPLEDDPLILEIIKRRISNSL
ncbi:MAG: sirohydrochlorin nickelochelatase [Methanobacteriaceae archaeon]|jgi:sirohydrochlorin cobaltochelatase|nr:sirohydrochlorin nickelochelatase [Methanobacteriaceae archaeon]